jgi:hypothetical protein
LPSSIGRKMFDVRLSLVPVLALGLWPGVSAGAQPAGQSAASQPAQKRRVEEMRRQIADVTAQGRVVELRRLIAEIAKSDDDVATEATERLTAIVIGPLAEALGALEQRPAAEQVRIRKALGALNAALRVRLLRADLPPADAQLFDAFAAKYRDLVQRLFDDDLRQRLAAIDRIPLEPGTGAGVLLVAKVNDWDDQVADAALKAAAALHDEVIARGLTRYIIDATATIKSGFYGPKDQELAEGVIAIVSRALQVLPKTKSKTDLPAIADAVQYLGHTPDAEVFDVPAVLTALGEMDDEAVAPALLSFLDQDRLSQTHALGPGKLVRQTVGDRALLSLLQIYKLDAANLAFTIPPDHEIKAGFMDAATRDAAHQAFRVWQQQNGALPTGQRSPLPRVVVQSPDSAPAASQPAPPTPVVQ